MRRIIAGLLSASLASYPEFTLAQIKPGGGAPVTAAGVSATSAGAIQGVTGGVPVPVTGTFTASLGGFTPASSGARMTPLAVVTTAGGTSGALPTGQTVDVISNAGATNPMYCNVNGVAATTSDQLIPPDSWFAFTIPSGVTTLNCISTGGTTTANGLGGAGLPTGAGGGGGGGSGGNVTIVGPLGTQAVAASVAVTPATSSVWPISAASLPLPTGAATSANQEVTVAGTSATSAQGVQGVTGGIAMAVTGSFSTTAFVQGATPMSAITLVGGTPQSNIAIPSGTTTLLITSSNVSVNQVHCRLDPTTSTVASATDVSIGPGQTLAFNATGLGVVSCEIGTGTQVVSFFPGSGQYQSTSAIAPSIGATGATIGFAQTVQGCALCVAVPGAVADGGSVTLGAKADTAATTGTVTEIALIKGLITQVQASIPVGTNLIGKVGIDQTTPGTTNGVSVTNANTNGSATSANSSPVVIASDQAAVPVSPTPYPATAVPITASATGTTAATTATLTNVTSHTTYICGFSVRSNATAAATGNITVTGVKTATMNFTHWTAPNASGVGVTEEVFSPCVPASAVSTSIAVVAPAAGTSGVESVSAWGYSL